MRATFTKLGIFLLISVITFSTHLACTSSSLSSNSSTPLPPTPRPLEKEKRTVVMGSSVIQHQLLLSTLPSPFPPTPTPAPLPPIQHIVQTGESLTLIAQAYAVSVEQLLVANPLTNPDLLYAGQMIIVPRPTLESVPNNVQPTPELFPSSVNGIPFDQILIMDEEVVANMRRIVAHGEELGRDLYAFAKAGDSTIESPHFLSRFDAGTYQLGDYQFLQPIITHFAGSFARDSVAVRIGFHSWSVTDPMWADKTLCEPNESPLECEIRLQNPAILFIRLGANDTGDPTGFDLQMREIVEITITNGVIPVLGTKADRHEGDNSNNLILRQIAADYHIPLWEFDKVAGTLPNRGLDEDSVHLTAFYPHDYTQPAAFQSGHAIHNLTALIALHQIWTIIAP